MFGEGDDVPYCACHHCYEVCLHDVYQLAQQLFALDLYEDRGLLAVLLVVQGKHRGQQLFQLLKVKNLHALDVQQHQFLEVKLQQDRILLQHTDSKQSKRSTW